MECSEKQLAANRANAQKSTGPKDTSKTKFNGVRHGLTATHTLLPWEHVDDLQSIIEAFEARFEPTDTFERLTVRQAAEAFWRMQRIARIEENLFETLATAEIQDSGHDPSELHAGHLEAISFIKGEQHIDRVRRYEAHLRRMYDKALKQVYEMASLRKPNAEPLPPAEPVKKELGVGLKQAPLRIEILHKQPVTVLGTLLDADSPETCNPPHFGDGILSA